MNYLVVGSGGPGFTSAEEAVNVLEGVILPSFDALMKLEKEKKILAGGLPVGDRSFVFIVEAASHEEVDALLRGLPMWGALDWEVTPIQNFAGRAAMERDIVKKAKPAKGKKNKAAGGGRGKSWETTDGLRADAAGDPLPPRPM